MIDPITHTEADDSVWKLSLIHIYVKAEVKKRIDSLAVGGGYLCGPTHNIQSDTPLENILTMYQTIKKFGLYPIRESNVDKKNITFIK